MEQKKLSILVRCPCFKLQALPVIREIKCFLLREVSSFQGCLIPPAEWLRMIGLPGYVRTFVEARIDSHMLNVISMVTDHMTSV